MNIYFVGMCLSLLVYVLIGLAISRKVKTVNDFYVAGRRAPVLLVAGSLIASYTSTGIFMGDAALCYEGAFSPTMILSGMLCVGYILGGVFFGRYLRRSQVLTIPEFFGKRFCSERMRILAAATAIITMTVYLLSVLQGIGTLMSAVTNVDYRLCLILSLVVLTFISVASGSRGVLITDTLMAGLFTSALVVAIIVIAGKGGGWIQSVQNIALDPELSPLLSWRGKPGALYDSGLENVIYGVTYGIVWLSVCMVGPWQSSRYLMARDEGVVVRSSYYSAFGVFMLQFLVGIAAVFVNLAYPNMEDPSLVMIWASMHMMPTILGVVMLAGVLAAGISSATTFMSLIGASFANDLLKLSGKRSINAGRFAMILAGLVVLALAVSNSPSIYWIMYLGGAIVASSWMPVVLACVFSRRVTRTGAFCGMLTGFAGCFAVRLYTSLSGVTLPVYLDPSLVGMAANVAAMAIGSALTRVSPEEKEARARLFVLPEIEKKPKDMRLTLRYAYGFMALGAVITLLMLALWVIPYLTAA